MEILADPTPLLGPERRFRHLVRGGACNVAVLFRPVRQNEKHGLPNVGCSCFQNAGLQFLALLPALRTAVAAMEPHSQFSLHFQAVMRIIAGLDHPSRERAKHVMKAFGHVFEASLSAAARRNRGDARSFQDSSEFMAKIIELVESATSSRVWAALSDSIQATQITTTRCPGEDLAAVKHDPLLVGKSDAVLKTLGDVTVTQMLDGIPVNSADMDYMCGFDYTPVKREVTLELSAPYLVVVVNRTNERVDFDSKPFRYTFSALRKLDKVLHDLGNVDDSLVSLGASHMTGDAQRELDGMFERQRARETRMKAKLLPWARSLDSLSDAEIPDAAAREAAVHLYVTVGMRVGNHKVYRQGLDDLDERDEYAKDVRDFATKYFWVADMPADTEGKAIVGEYKAWYKRWRALYYAGDRGAFVGGDSVDRRVKFDDATMTVEWRGKLLTLMGAARGTGEHYFTLGRTEDNSWTEYDDDTVSGLDAAAAQDVAERCVVLLFRVT